MSSSVVASSLASSTRPPAAMISSSVMPRPSDRLAIVPPPLRTARRPCRDDPADQLAGLADAIGEDHPQGPTVDLARHPEAPLAIVLARVLVDHDAPGEHPGGV